MAEFKAYGREGPRQGGEEHTFLVTLEFFLHQLLLSSLTSTLTFLGKV